MPLHGKGCTAYSGRVGCDKKESEVEGWGMIAIAMGTCAFLAMTIPATGGVASGEAQTGSTPATHKKQTAAAPKPSSSAKNSGNKAKASKKASVSSKGRKGKRGIANKPTAQTIRLTSAFKASEQLRPMAQQLAMTRSAAAYNGVESYARQHPGEGAAAAYLALGHAYMLDHRYADATSAYHQANVSGTALDDYPVYWGPTAAA